MLEKISRLTPPPKLPRGYFDNLTVPTRMLLDRGFKIHQCADWLIGERVLEPKERRSYMDAMRGRVSRLRRKRITQAAAAGTFAWRENLFHDSTHLVAGEERRALCGVSATAWTGARSESNRCARCAGLQRKHSIAAAA